MYINGIGNYLVFYIFGYAGHYLTKKKQQHFAELYLYIFNFVISALLIPFYRLSLLIT